MPSPQDAPQHVSADDVDRIGAELAGVFGPTHAASDPADPPERDETWTFEGGKGTAWVFYADGHTQPTDPLIASDGFKNAPSKLEDWSVLWTDDPDDPKGYAWGKDLSAAGKDLIILGYTGGSPLVPANINRMHSILDNAKIAKACIKKAIERRGPAGAPLVVGGFSMGGLITRYTLALMEWELSNGVEGAVDHQTSTYFSYDSPHRGGWVPTSVQAFAHYLKGLTPSIPQLTAMLNSPASRQMAAYHIATHTGNPTPDTDPERTRFLEELERVGWFPQQVKRRIAVANGPADGSVRTVPSVTFELDSPTRQALLYGQAPDDEHLVAALSKRASQDDEWDEVSVRTSGIPALDGAPGGTLATNQIAVTLLATLFPNATELSTAFPWVCFVPTVSAVDFADPRTSATVPVPASPPDGSAFHAYKCASASSDPSRLEHTLLTEELCTWITANLE